MNQPEARLVLTLKAYFESLGYFVARELDMGYGRADLVAFRISPENCLKRLRNGQFRSLDRYEHYSLLRVIPEIGGGEPIPLEILASQFPLSLRFLRQNLIAFLIRAGYVQEVKKQAYAKINGFVPLADEIIAVEAKVSDWHRGAVQAKRYQVFANRVYLAVSDDFVHRVNLHRLASHGIGLLGVSENRIDKYLFAPHREPMDRDRFNFAAEWVWRHKRPELRERARYASE